MPKRAAAKKKMPAFTKPTAATVTAFDAAIDGLSGVERRTMFGYPAAFLNGNMLGSVFQDRIMVRLSESDREKALKIEGAKRFEPMAGRPMKEYVEFPPAVVAKKAELRLWFDRARDYVETLPKKKKK